MPKLNPYFLENLKKHNFKSTEAMLGWLTEYVEAKEKGEDFKGMDGDEAADLIMNGIKRLQKFYEKFMPEGKKLSINLTGHSWGIDAFLAKTLNGGVLNKDAIEKLHGQMIQPAEMAKISYDGDKIKINYHDEDTLVNQ